MKSSAAGGKQLDQRYVHMEGKGGTCKTSRTSSVSAALVALKASAIVMLSFKKRDASRWGGNEARILGKECDARSECGGDIRWQSYDGAPAVPKSRYESGGVKRMASEG